MQTPSYTCPYCGATSYNRRDIEHRYCGACHRWETGESDVEMVNKLPTSRTCAGCDVCCTAASVADLGKPAGVRCKHLTALTPAGRNCLIYAKRPHDCASFVCLWRASDNTLDDSFFPADCGFCLYLNDFLREQGPMVVTVGLDPARPTAWDQPHFRARFTLLAWELNCIVAIGQGALCTHVFSPNGNVYSKEDYPMFFVEGGRSVGVPVQDFRPESEVTLEDVARRVLGA